MPVATKKQVSELLKLGEFHSIISQLRKMSRSLIKYGQLPEKRTAFFLCDIQEKFRPALSHFEQIVEAAKKLVC